MSRRRQRPAKSTEVPTDAPHATAESPSTDALLWGLFLLLAFLLGCVEMTDTDIWWHLRTGQLIWERGEIPRTDWYTDAGADARWIDLHWGFQLSVAGLWWLGNVPALVVAKSLVGTATFALCLAAQPRSWPRWPAAAFWLPSLLLFAGRFDVRPEMLSLLLFAATLAILFHLRAHPRLVWLLPAVQLIWVNVHALFILGQALWALYLIDAALRPCLPWSSPASERGPTRWRWWLAATGLQGLASLLNPYGWEGATFPAVLWTRLQGSDRDFYRQFAGEFAGMNEFLSQYGWAAVVQALSPLMMLTIAVAAAISFVLLARRRAFSLFRLLLFLAFGYLAWQANRNGVFFALAGGAVLRWNMGDWLAAGQAKSPARFQYGQVVLAAVLGLLVVLTPLQMISLLRPLPSPRFNPAFREWGRPPFGILPRWFGLEETPYWYAHDAARFLAQPGMPDRVYASHLGHASLCIYHLGPERKLLADPRLEVNSRATLARYLEIYQRLAAHDPAAEKLLASPADGRLPALLLGTADIFPIHERFFSHPRWRPVYADPVAVVLLPAAQADLLALPAVSWEQALGESPAQPELEPGR